MKKIRFIFAAALLTVSMLNGCRREQEKETSADTLQEAEEPAVLETSEAAQEEAETERSKEKEETTESKTEAETAVETAAETEAETDTAEEKQDEEHAEIHFTPEELPRFDGSTSTAPLAEALIAKLLGISRVDAALLVNFNKTTTAYKNLLNGDADILIIGEANEEVLQLKEQLGVEWLREPFATDAFVFIVNENNPVDSITIEQAKKIYTGEIANWKELGGNDVPIEAFQRNSAAGSQTLMEKWVMQGTPMKEAPAEYVVSTMEGLMQTVKQYDNGAAAIGYSVYYYAEEMRMAQGLKMLKLEGVEPNPETIRSGEYPIVNPKYAVINAETGEESPARRIFDYLLSEEGQQLIAEEGYVSVQPFDRPKQEEQKYNAGRRYPEMTTALPAAPDYGILIPYVGRRNVALWPAANGCIYGLMTTDGEIITDPGYCNYRSNGKYLLLTSAEADPDGKKRITFAAADGSFVDERIYCLYQAEGDGRIVLFDRECGMTLVDADGTVHERIPAEKTGLTEEGLFNLERTVSDGSLIWAGGHILLDSRETEPGSMQVQCTLYNLENEETVTESFEFYSSLCMQEHFPNPFPAGVDINEYNYILDGYDPTLPPMLSQTEYTDDSLKTTYFKRDKSFVAEAEGYSSGPSFVCKYNNIYGVITADEAAYYRYEDDSLIFRMPLEPLPTEPDPEPDIE